MMDELKIWLADAPVSLPNDPGLKSDITALKYCYRGSLRLIESKDDAKKRGIKSPDRLDSLALTLAKPAKKQQSLPKNPQWHVMTPGMGY